MILAHLRKMQHGARLSRVMTANSVARWLRHMRLDDMDAADRLVRQIARQRQ